MTDYDVWPASKTAHLGNAAGGSVIPQDPNGLTPQSTINQIAAAMDSTSQESHRTPIPPEHAHLAPSRGDINYPKLGRPMTRMVDPKSQDAATVISDLMGQGYEVIGG